MWNSEVSGISMWRTGCNPEQFSCLDNRPSRGLISRRRTVGTCDGLDILQKGHSLLHLYSESIWCPWSVNQLHPFQVIPPEKGDADIWPWSDLLPFWRPLFSILYKCLNCSFSHCCILLKCWHLGTYRDEPQRQKALRLTKERGLFFRMFQLTCTSESFQNSMYKNAISRK